MKTTIYIALGLTFMYLISGCGLPQALQGVGDGFTGEIDEIQAELFPLDSASKKIIIGLLEGAVTESSKDNIDTLSKKLSDGISKFINAKIKEIDTRSAGANLMGGIKDEINDPAFKDSLNALVNFAFGELRSQLKPTIDNLFIDLSSPENKQRLESLAASLFTKENSEKLNEFINKGIEGISFAPLADSLRANLFNEEMGRSVGNIIPPEIDSILTKTEGILDKLNENGESFIERNVWTIVGGIASLMLLGGLVYQWKKKSEGVEINDSIMSAIHAMKDTPQYDLLTTQIKRNAIQKGIEAPLNKRLHQLGLSKSKKLETE